MGGKRMYKPVISLTLAALFLTARFAFSIEPAAILGDAVGKGKTEMKTAFDRWISISDKAYPVFNGAGLRTGDGMISSIFRDGVRTEIGKNSELLIRGSKGNYVIDLSRGKIAFSVPSGVAFSVETPAATVQTRSTVAAIRNVSLSAQEHVRGTVGYDGKAAIVTALSGTLVVSDPRGAATRTLSAGNSLYISGVEGGFRPVPAQLAEVQTNGNTNPKGPVTNAPAKEGPELSPLIVAGGGAGIIGGTYFTVNSTTKTKGVASPSKP